VRIWSVGPSLHQIAERFRIGKRAAEGHMEALVRRGALRHEPGHPRQVEILTRAAFTSELLRGQG